MEPRGGRLDSRVTAAAYSDHPVSAMMSDTVGLLEMDENGPPPHPRLYATIAREESTQGRLHAGIIYCELDHDGGTPT